MRKFDTYRVIKCRTDDHKKKKDNNDYNKNNENNTWKKAQSFFFCRGRLSENQFSSHLAAWVSCCFASCQDRDIRIIKGI